MLKPQPAPLPGGREVAKYFLEVFDDQVARGLRNYGAPLTTFNGRDCLLDAITEAVDLGMYLCQRKLQDEEIARVLLGACDAVAEKKWKVGTDLIGYALELLDGKPPKPDGTYYPQYLNPS